MGTRALAALALAALLPAACASDRPLPAEVPDDFLLVVEAKDATDPPCELRVTLDASGAMRYDVRHRGPAPADRRGASVADPAAVRAVWDAVVACGFLGQPDSLAAPEGAEAAGTISLSLVADGREKSVVAPRGANASIDALLDAVVAAGPPRLLRPPGAE
jgi:hypothetical protein